MMARVSAESATWRNAYLYGAQELRHGTPDFGAARGRGLGHAMTVEQLVDGLGIRFDPARYPRNGVRINVEFTDLGERHVIGVARCAVHHDADTADPDAAVSVVTTRTVLVDILGGVLRLEDAVDAGSISLDGDIGALAELLDALEVFTTQAVVEP